MSRFKGSTSSQASKEISAEIEAITGIPYKRNFTDIRLIQLCVLHRVAELVREKDNIDSSDKRSEVVVEIPLIGFLTITPRVFHKKHGRSEENSIHFDYAFTPTSGFKADVHKAFTLGEADLAEYAINEYFSKRIKEIYKGEEE